MKIVRESISFQRDPKSQKHLEEIKKLSGGITPRL